MTNPLQFHRPSPLDTYSMNNAPSPDRVAGERSKQAGISVETVLEQVNLKTDADDIDGVLPAPAGHALTSNPLGSLNGKSVLGDIWELMSAFQSFAQLLRDVGFKQRTFDMQAQITDLMNAAEEIAQAAIKRFVGACISGGAQVLGGLVTMGMGAGGALAGAKGIALGKNPAVSKGPVVGKNPAQKLAGNSMDSDGIELRTFSEPSNVKPSSKDFVREPAKSGQEPLHSAQELVARKPVSSAQEPPESGQESPHSAQELAARQELDTQKLAARRELDAQKLAARELDAQKLDAQKLAARELASRQWLNAGTALSHTSQGAGSGLSGMGSMMGGGAEGLAAGHDAEKTRLEADAKKRDTDYAQDNELVQQYQQAIDDARGALRTMVQAYNDANRSAVQKI